MILIGTYWVGQFKKWKGYYNYPISDADKIDPKSYAKINELWLFNGTKAQHTFAAEFVGVKTRKELVAEYKYPAKGSDHSNKYLLFKIKRQLQPSKTADGYFIRTKDFACRSPKIAAQLKAYLESPDRKNAALAAKLPRIVTKLPASKLVVGEEALQMVGAGDVTAVKNPFVWSSFPKAKDVVDQLEYSVVCINEFARKNGLSRDRACDFLNRYKGLEHLVRFYDVESTMPLDLIVEDLGRVCARNGGRL